MTEAYSDIRIRKVRILQGKAREAADKVGAHDDDLVILKITQSNSQPTYAPEKIDGDPMAYLLRAKKESA